MPSTETAQPVREALGDRMKRMESEEAQVLQTTLPICIRLDGRAFHSFCKGLVRPFDPNFRSLMVEVTKELVEQTNAVIGYTQSDEISLILWNDDPKAQVYFGGRVQKTVSTLASYCSVRFNQLLPSYLPAKVGTCPTFDCRAWNVPTLEEAANVLLWREQDAIKNSIASSAQYYFSHKQLHGLHTDQQVSLLLTKGVDWDKYPAAFKRGSYVARRIVSTKWTQAELDALPPQHDARKNPDLVVRRAVIGCLDLPPLGTISNRVAVLFYGAEWVWR